jgi:hypothetical protein
LVVLFLFIERRIKKKCYDMIFAREESKKTFYGIHQCI